MLLKFIHSLNKGIKMVYKFGANFALFCIYIWLIISIDAINLYKLTGCIKAILANEKANNMK